MGYTQLRYARLDDSGLGVRDSVSSGASLGAFLARTTPALTLVTSGTAVAGTDGSLVALGIAAGAWRPFTRGAWQTELGATLTALGSNELRPSSGATAYARQQYARPATYAFRGAWAGLGGGLLDQEPSARRFVSVDAGAAWGWRTQGLLSASVTHVRLHVDSFDVTPESYLPAQSMSYSDAAVALRWTLPRLDLDAAAGLRAGEEPADAADNPVEERLVGTRAYYSASASWWVRPRAALVVGAGRALADPTRGTASADYVTAAVRLTIGATRTPPTAPVVRPPGTRGPTVTVARVDGVVLLRIVAPSAGQVEVMGDFTEWQPVALARGDGGVWSHSLAIAPGPIRLRVRLDGGEWVVPGNVPVASDEFGGRVGLVVVP